MKRFFRTSILIVLSVLIAFGTILAPAAFADPGEAVSRTQAFINLGKQKSMVDAGLGDLTADESRFLGTYLSNFYVPFHSEFGGTLATTEQGQKAKEDTVKSLTAALVSKVNFKEDVASTFAEYVIANVWKGSKELKVEYVTKSGSSTTPELPLSWPNFLDMVSGQFEDTKHGFMSRNEDFVIGNIFYEKDGKKVVVFEFDPRGRTMTPSVASLYQALNMADLKGGQAISLFDLQTTDIDLSKKPNDDKETERVFNLIKDKLYDQTFFNSKMAVSPFGDLVVRGPNHTYVAIPASMNAGTWKPEGVAPGPSAGVTAANPTLIYVAASYQNMVLKASGGSSLTKTSAKEGSESVMMGSFDTTPAQKHIGDSLGGLSTWKIDVPFTLPGMEYFTSDEQKSMLDETRAYFLGYKRRIQIGSAETKVVTDQTWYGAFKDVGWGDAFAKLSDDNLKDRSQNIYGIYSASAESYQTILQHAEFKDVDADKLKECQDLTATSVFGGNFGSLKKNVQEQISIKCEHNLTGGAASVQSATGPDIPVSTKLLVIDDLAVYQGTDTPDNYVDIISSDGTALVKITEGMETSQVTAFQAAMQSNSDVLAKVTESMPKAAGASLFLTYLMSAFGNEDVKAKLGYSMNIEAMPPLVDATLPIDTTAAKNARVDAITNYLYFILNPSWDFVDYVAQLVTSKVSGVMIRWHEDMTGTQSVGIVSGSTKYIGFSGFVSTPNLHDLQWTDSLINVYNDIVVYVVIAMFVVLVLYLILRRVSPTQAVVSFIVFIVAALAVIPTINAAIDLSNRVSDSVYSEKFTYWALVTHQSYSAQIDEAAEGDSYQNYLSVLFNNTASEGVNLLTGEPSANAISNRGGENVILKWQTPKKQLSKPIDGDLADSLGSSPSLQKLWTGAVTAAYSGQTYLDDPESTYLYRSYVDISNASRYTYMGLSDRYDTKRQDTPKTFSPLWTPEYLATQSQRTKAIETAQKNGWSNYPMTGSSSADSYVYVTAPSGSKVVNDHLADYKKLDNIKYGEYVGIPSGALSSSIAPFTQGTKFVDDIQSQNPPGYDASAAGYSESDYASLSAFALMSESPYYHFSWKMYDGGLDPRASGSGGFRNMVLAPADQGFFYNSVTRNDASEGDPTYGQATEAQSGELKDYLGMRELFTYTIPYLKAANKTVQEYDQRFGLQFHDGVPFDPGHENDPEIKDNPDVRQKYWHNVNVVQLANQYTAWVDLLYSTKAADPQIITHNGKTITISDPLNPASYPADRPMVFSAAEAIDYGLSKADLTTAEARIQSVLENTREDYYNLLNYYTFKDTVLNSAASMLATFEFNKTFSDVDLLGEGTQLFPQSYELKNFSYDAYLRMILANSLGKDMLKTDSSFYQSVVQESNIFTAFGLVASDVLSIYVLPLLKYATVIALCVVALCFLAATILDPTGNNVVKTVFRVIVKPLAMFFSITVGFTLLISLFMGNPVSSVTGASQFSIKIGDPVMTLILLMGICLVAALLYGKVLMGVLKDIKTYGSVAASAATGAFASVGSGMLKGFAAAGAVAGGVAAGVSSIGRGVSSGVSNTVAGGSNIVVNARANRAARADMVDDLNEGRDKTIAANKRNATSMAKQEAAEKNYANKKKQAELAEEKKNEINQKIRNSNLSTFNRRSAGINRAN